METLAPDWGQPQGAPARRPWAVTRATRNLVRSNMRPRDNTFTRNRTGRQFQNVSDRGLCRHPHRRPRHRTCRVRFRSRRQLEHRRFKCLSTRTRKHRRILTHHGAAVPSRCRVLPCTRPRSVLRHINAPCRATLPPRSHTPTRLNISMRRSIQKSNMPPRAHRSSLSRILRRLST